MARLTVRSRDKNRFSKNYPHVRAPKRLTFEGDSDVVIELIQLTFSNESSKSGNYSVPFENNDFRVLVSPRDTTASDSANVVLSIDDNLSDRTKVTVDSSAPFTGIVDVIAIKVGT